MDPYKVLGISPGASEQQIKEAYMKLAKKYHPDINQGNNEAEKKMKEVNAAYDMLKKGYSGSAGSQSGYDGTAGYSGYRGNSGYSGYSSAGENYSNTDPQMHAALHYLQNGYYSEALSALNGVRNRSALWYYYAAAANYGLGRKAGAMDYINQAISMDPGNYEFMQFKNYISSSANTYQSYGGGLSGFGNPAGMCTKMFIAQLFCLICSGGRFIWCC